MRSRGNDGTVADFTITDNDGQIDETNGSQLYFVESDDPIVMKNSE